MGLLCTRTQGNRLVTTLKTVKVNVLNRHCRTDRAKIEASVQRFDEVLEQRERHAHFFDVVSKAIQGDRELDRRKAPAPTGVCNAPANMPTVDIPAGLQWGRRRGSDGVVEGEGNRIRKSPVP
jgi:hypothetical protein